jgi:outer membrane murein-binding lipoprotein Lpp
VLATLLSLTGCRNTRVIDLEKRVDALEQDVRQLQTDRAKAADNDLARRAKMENCVAEANATFDKWMASNGTRQGNGYNVPVTIVEQIQRQKQGKFDECRLLYSK